MNSYSCVARTRASLTLTLPLWLLISPSFAQVGHAGNQSPFVRGLAIEMGQARAATLERKKRSVAQRRATRKSKARRQSGQATDAQRRAIREAEEAAKRDAERETLRALDRSLRQELWRSR